MKLPILLICGLMCFGAAFADDEVAPKIVERKTCEQIKIEINTMSEIETPDDATRDELKQLQTQYRNSCMPKSAGRRTVARSLPIVTVTPSAEQVAAATATSDALSDYLAAKKSNCEKLNSEIAKSAAANDDSKSDALAAMRGVYDMDCTDKNAPKESATPEMSEEEWIKKYDDNLAAGLCGDGTKPNRYGCCTDETFRDMGNLVFACCPKTGGDCFPPIK